MLQLWETLLIFCFEHSPLHFLCSLFLDSHYLDFRTSGWTANVSVYVYHFSSACLLPCLLENFLNFFFQPFYWVFSFAIMFLVLRDFLFPSRDLCTFESSILPLFLWWYLFLPQNINGSIPLKKCVFSHMVCFLWVPFFAYFFGFYPPYWRLPSDVWLFSFPQK